MPTKINWAIPCLFFLLGLPHLAWAQPSATLSPQPVAAQLFAPQNPKPPTNQAMLEAVNQARRTKCRCGGTLTKKVKPLRWNDALARAAQIHADDMARNDFLDHKGSNGSRPAQRAKAQGYAYTIVGENCAEGQETLAEAMDAWLRSPGHCRNIKDREFRDLGMAVAWSEDGVPFWVQVFGSTK